MQYALFYFKSLHVCQPTVLTDSTKCLHAGIHSEICMLMTPCCLSECASDLQSQLHVIRFVRYCDRYIKLGCLLIRQLQSLKVMVIHSYRECQVVFRDEFSCLGCPLQKWRL